MTPKKNYYDILQVPPTATAEQIKESYQDLIRKNHPDLTANTGEQFSQVLEAYRVLRDPKARKSYDENLSWEKVCNDLAHEFKKLQNLIHEARVDDVKKMQYVTALSVMAHIALVISAPLKCSSITNTLFLVGTCLNLYLIYNGVKEIQHVKNRNTLFRKLIPSLKEISDLTEHQRLQITPKLKY